MTNIKTKSKSELFEGTPVVFTPLKPGGKHPELVVVDLRDLIEASERHRTETALAYQAGVKETVEEVEKLIIDEMLISQKEGQPTSRLTSLSTKLKLLSHLSTKPEKEP